MPFEISHLTTAPLTRTSLKILQIASGQFVNGALVHVDLLTRELINRGHDVSLLCRPRSWIWRRLYRTGIPMRKSSLKRFPPNELWRIAQWIREEHFDVIHTHMSSAHFFGVLLRAMTGVPCVATAHTSHFQLHWRFNDLVIANSQSTCEFQQKTNRVPNSKLLTIPCFVDLEKFTEIDPATRNRIRQAWGIPDQRPVIGVVGAVNPRKGQLRLVEALPKLIRQFPDLKVLFIGQFERNDAYYRQIRRTLFEQKLFRRVLWTGRRNNVHELVQGLDVCVVPSRKEPLGLCALEAMAAQVPVVAADVGGLREFVIPEQTGLLFNPEDPSGVAGQVARMIVDTELRSRVIAHGLEMLQSRFSPTAITAEIEAAYRIAIESRTQHPSPADP